MRGVLLAALLDETPGRELPLQPRGQAKQEAPSRASGSDLSAEIQSLFAKKLRRTGLIARYFFHASAMLLARFCVFVSVLFPAIPQTFLT